MHGAADNSDSVEIFAGLVRFVVFNTDSREIKEKDRGRRGAGCGMVLGWSWAGLLGWLGLARPFSFFFDKLFPFFFSLFLKLKIKTGQNFL